MINLGKVSVETKSKSPIPFDTSGPPGTPL